jgi:hypothetical protein
LYAHLAVRREKIDDRKNILETRLNEDENALTVEE